MMTVKTGAIAPIREEYQMKTMGLDIGTTTISAAVRDDRAGILTTRTLENNSFLPGKTGNGYRIPR